MINVFPPSEQNGYTELPLWVDRVIRWINSKGFVDKAMYFQMMPPCDEIVAKHYLGFPSPAIRFHYLKDESLLTEGILQDAVWKILNLYGAWINKVNPPWLDWYLFANPLVVFPDKFADANLGEAVYVAKFGFEYPRHLRGVSATIIDGVG